MADKLNEKSWKAFTAQHKIDGADVMKRLQTYARLPDAEYADRLDALADLIKSLDGAVAAVKKDKALAAKKDELKAVSVYLAAMQKEAADERKAVELAKAKAEKEAARSGLQKVDVQIIGKSWNGEPLRKMLMQSRLAGARDLDGELIATGAIAPLISIDDLLTVRAILANAGDVKPAGVTFLQIETGDNSLRHLESKHGPATSAPAAPVKPAAALIWTPRATKLAQEAGLDPATVTGIEATGPGGRVSGDDVTRFLATRKS